MQALAMRVVSRVRGWVRPNASEEESGFDLGRLAGRAFVLTCLLALVVLTFKVVHAFRIDAVWDDAYIFQRYARNLWRGDGLAWNPGGEPTYGLTALLYVVPVSLVQRLASDNASLAAISTSTLFGVVFVALAITMVWRDGGGTKTARKIAIVVTLLCLATSETSAHFGSGMDTTFGLCWAALMLMAASRIEKLERGWLALGLLSGLALWVRPELCAYSAALTLSLAALGRTPAVRRNGRLALLVTVAVVAAELGIARWYFGSALPLPFHVKSVGFYSERMHYVYRSVAGKELASYIIAGYGALLLIIAVDVLAGVRRWTRRSSATDKAALSATIVCLAYGLYGALPIMAMNQRYFHPTLPALIFLAARSIGRLYEPIGQALKERLAPIAPAIALVALGLSWVWLTPEFSKSGNNFATAMGTYQFRFDLPQVAETKGVQQYWARIDKISALPDDLVIATTEVGVPGALNPNKIIIDMAGLNDRAFAHQRFKASALFEQHTPDFFWMPHPDYRTLVAELVPELEKRNYEVYGAKRVGARLFGIAIHRDSPHYEAMRKALGKVALGRIDKRRHNSLINSTR